jgi:enoyl-CoA hydratase/carnithine racemase
MTKRLFEPAYDAPLDQQLALEAELQQAATERPTTSEKGVQAFLDKRPPAFTGA